MRGYSAQPASWGQEQLVEEIAEELGMDPLEFRRINCLKDGTTNATGTVLDHAEYAGGHGLHRGKDRLPAQA